MFRLDLPSSLIGAVGLIVSGTVASAGCTSFDGLAVPQVPGVRGGAGRGGADVAVAGGRPGGGATAATPLDAGVVESSDPLRADGAACEFGGQCASGYCDNGLCCAGGQCCATVDDCASADESVQVCDYANTCQ